MAYVQPLAERLTAPIFLPLDVTQADQQVALFDKIAKTWGRLDFLLHSIAFAPKADLQGRVTDSSREGFLTAIDVSCHSRFSAGEGGGTIDEGWGRNPYAKLLRCD